MKSLNVFLVALLLVISPLCSLSAAMGGGEIVEKLMARYKDSRTDIYDMVTEFDDGVIYEKRVEKDDGSVVYKMRWEEMVDGEMQISVYDGQYFYTKDPKSGEVARQEIEIGPMAFFQYLKSRELTHEGVNKVNGHPCHVLRMEEVDVENMVNPTTGEPVDLHGHSEAVEEALVEAVLFIDEEHWVIRKIQYNIKGLKLGTGDERGVSLSVDNRDYQEVHGMMLPFETVSVITVEMTDEERRQAREMERNLKRMEKEMEDMSESQQEMIRNQMESRMGGISSLMLKGEMTYVTKIKSVEVNLGLSDQLFIGGEI